MKGLKSTFNMATILELFHIANEVKKRRNIEVRMHDLIMKIAKPIRSQGFLIIGSKVMSCACAVQNLIFGKKEACAAIHWKIGNNK